MKTYEIRRNYKEWTSSSRKEDWDGWDMCCAWKTTGYQSKLHDGKCTRRAGRPRSNWIDTVSRDLKSIGMAWEDAEQAAVDREDWRGRVAQCVFDTGWTKVRSKVITGDSWLSAFGVISTRKAVNACFYLDQIINMDVATYAWEIDRQTTVTAEKQISTRHLG